MVSAGLEYVGGARGSCIVSTAGPGIRILC